MESQRNGTVEYSPQILQEIRQQTGGSLHGIFLAETTSTNSQLKNLAKAGELTEPTVLITNLQTAGRGTRERPWFQAPGKDIAFSLAIPFEGDDLHDPRFSLAVGAMLGTELATALKPHCDVLAISHKWPNDLLLGQPPKKCGGILIETTAGWMVIGIGLNLNSLVQDFPENISHNTTTIREQLGQELERDALVAKLVVGISRSLGITGAAGREGIDIAYWMKQWCKRDATGGKRYLLQRGGSSIPVEAEGVDAQSGGLICRGMDGRRFIVTSYTELEEIA